jgi:hypothetical protein
MIYTHLAAALIAAFIAGTGAWKVQDWRYASAEKDRMEAEAKERGIQLQRVDTAAVAHQGDTERLRSEFIVITERVTDALQTPFYAAAAPACLDDSGVRDVNAASGNLDAGSEPAAAMPRSAASR